MKKHHWMISGVGRSGTTLAYNALLTVARSMDANALGRYEPFLWGEPVWDKFPSEFGVAFQSTSTISAEGLCWHLQTPLFLSTGLDDFVDNVLPSDRNVLAKFIRGAGRLEAFLHRDLELKVVHFIRNPLDVVNSALQSFSFYGAEFHPSDEPRFNVEAMQKFPNQFRSTLAMTHGEKSLEWWRVMNEAALETAQKFPDRVKVVPYEYLISDRLGVMTEIVNFLEGDVEALAGAKLSGYVGPVAGGVCLESGDRDAIMPSAERYFSDTRVFSNLMKPAEIAVIKSKLMGKYSACTEGRGFVRHIDPSLSPLRVRAIAVQAEDQVLSERAAGVKQVSEITSGIVAALEKMQQRDAEWEGKIALGEERVRGLEAQIAERDQHIADLERNNARVKRQTESDLLASRQLINRLRDRISGLRDEARATAKVYEKKQMERRAISDKLRAAEKRLKVVAGEGEHHRRQLVELSTVVAPRLRTILTLRPIRYVLRQRQRIKSGVVELDDNGVPQLKK